jgi:adenylate cyclase
MLFSNNAVLNILFPIISVVVASIVAMIIKYIFEARQNKVIKNKFSQKISKNVMNQLLENDSSDIMKGKLKEVTIFFSDIRDFTNMSESIKDPQELLLLLNRYIEPMSKIILDSEGTIDKFIGDSIMAYWNAPVDVENHADKAVVSAIEQIKALEQMNKTAKIKIKIGIGINTGNAVVGEMGSLDRSDYTIIGDSVNLSSRVESLCKFYGSLITITSFTKDKLLDEYIFRFLDLVEVKGKKQAVEIWQVYGLGKANKELNKELELYHHAIKLYKTELFSKALTIFEKLENYKYKANDNIYKIYIDRCKYYIENKPSNFDGVFVHTKK